MAKARTCAGAREGEADVHLMTSSCAAGGGTMIPPLFLLTDAQTAAGPHSFHGGGHTHICSRGNNGGAGFGL